MSDIDKDALEKAFGAAWNAVLRMQPRFFEIYHSETGARHNLTGTQLDPVIEAAILAYLTAMDEKRPAPEDIARNTPAPGHFLGASPGNEEHANWCYGRIAAAIKADREGR